MKTFSQIISEGYTYPEIIPEDLQGVIYDWYQFREVCDDDKFVPFFDRLLNKCYRQYDQLMRIEPGIADYDWLVSQYKELQREATDNSTDVISSEGSSTKAEATTEGNEQTDTKTYNVTDTGSSTKDNTDTTTYNLAEGGSVSRDEDASLTVAETRTKDDTRTLSKEDVVDTDTTDENYKNTKGANKTLPMSTSGIVVTDGALDGLDWTTASAQNESTDREHGSGTIDTTTTTSQEDVLDSDETVSRTETKDGGYTDTSSSTKTGTETRVTDYEDTSTKQKTGTETNVKDADKTRSSNITNTSEDETTKTTAATGLVREITTGRNDQIAHVLEAAKKFIVDTDAWDWLMSQIDTVFMGVYDV